MTDELTRMFVPIALGASGYFITNFAIRPVLKIMEIRQKMHEAILQYANIWGVDQNNEDYSRSIQNKAREDYRMLAANGAAEHENICFSTLYFIARIFLCIRNIKLKEAAGKFWAMEAYAAQPDVQGRKNIVAEIRAHLKLPEES